MAKKEGSGKSLSGRKQHWRIGSEHQSHLTGVVREKHADSSRLETGNNLRPFQAPRNDLCRRAGGKERECKEKEGRMSGLRNSCTPSSSERASSSLVEKEASRSLSGSETGTMVPFLSPSSGVRDGTSTPQRKMQDTSVVVRVARKSEKSPKGNRAVRRLLVV